MRARVQHCKPHFVAVHLAPAMTGQPVWLEWMSCKDGDGPSFHVPCPRPELMPEPGMGADPAAQPPCAMAPMPRCYQKLGNAHPWSPRACPRTSESPSGLMLQKSRASPRFGKKATCPCVCACMCIIKWVAARVQGVRVWLL